MIVFLLGIVAFIFYRIGFEEGFDRAIKEMKKIKFKK
jgi:hypothetical protein